MAEVLEDCADGVLRLTINLPERRNPMTFEVLRSLLEHFTAARDRPDVRVIVLEGAGGRAFCAGGDLSSMDGKQDGVLPAHRARGRLAELFTAMWEAGVPTIAKVQGYALAGGCGLALACDFVVAGEGSVFGLPEIDVGLWPYMATIPLLRSMPPKVALDLMLTGRRVPAEEGQRIGFVTRLVPADDLEAEVAELAATLAAKPADTLRLGRDSFYRILDMRADDAFAALHPLLSVTATTDDAAEGLAAFAEKRPPRWARR